MTAALGEACDDLAALWPALAAALARDTAATDMPGAHTWMTRLVNEDVHAATLILGREVPMVTRQACDAIGEPWQPRGIPACLRQLPRLAERLGHLGHTAEQAKVTSAVHDWLRLVKRALGLRKPDMLVDRTAAYRCPYADSVPEEHAEACRLFAAGEEGFLRRGTGRWVQWVVQERIYCAAECVRRVVARRNGLTWAACCGA